jgi:hypothetical protein
MAKRSTALFVGCVALASACSSDATSNNGMSMSEAGAGGAGDDSCNPLDADGIVGGTNTVKLSVSDTAFAVGGVNSDSTQRNITVQNLSTVQLTITNTGTKPHDFVVSCIPSGLPVGCLSTSCFPARIANLSPIEPGDSVTVTFQTPAVEGAYRFISDLPGDTSTDASGNVTGLVGEFVLT